MAQAMIAERVTRPCPWFYGSDHPEEFIDWIVAIEEYFNGKRYSDDKKFSLAVLNLRQDACQWWRTLGKQQLLEKKRGSMWERLKELMEARFLPPTSRANWCADNIEANCATILTHPQDDINEKQAENCLSELEQSPPPSMLDAMRPCLDAIAKEDILGHRGGLREYFTANPTLALDSPSTVPKINDVGLKTRHIRKVAVIGGSLMGSGIATALLLSDIHVNLKEIDSTFLQRGMKSIAANLDGLVKKGSLTLDKKNNALLILKGALDYSDFGNVDMVVFKAALDNMENVYLRPSPKPPWIMVRVGNPNA